MIINLGLNMKNTQKSFKSYDIFRSGKGHLVQHTCPFSGWSQAQLSCCFTTSLILHKPSCMSLELFVLFVSNCFSLVTYSICLLPISWSIKVHIVFSSIRHVTSISIENSELHNQSPMWKSNVPKWCMLDNAVKTRSCTVSNTFK